MRGICAGVSANSIASVTGSSGTVGNPWDGVLVDAARCANRVLSMPANLLGGSVVEPVVAFWVVELTAGELVLGVTLA